MWNLFRFRCFLFLSSFFLLSSSVRAEGPFRFEIGVEKGEILQGEPIVARVLVKNVSGGPVPVPYKSNEEFTAQIAPVFTFESKSGEVVAKGVIHPKGYRTLLLSKLEAGSSLLGEKMFLPLPVSRGSGDENLLNPGKYQMSAKLPWMDAYFLWNPVGIEVRSPTGEEAVVVKLIDPRKLALFFEGISGADPPPPIEVLLRDHPETVYAKLARLRLTIDKARSIWQTRSGNLSADKKESMRRLAEEGIAFAKALDRHPLCDNLLLHCSRLQRLIGDYREELKTLEIIQQGFPDSDVLELVNDRTKSATEGR